MIAGPSTVTTTVGGTTAGEAVGDGEDVIDVSRCIDDQFSVTSPGNAAPPVICGTNTGNLAQAIGKIVFRNSIFQSVISH